jgi:hypothetical protein
MKLFDPTSTPRERTVALAPRLRNLRGLRVGLVENTKFNSDVILAKLGERLTREYGMTVSVHPVTPSPRKRPTSCAASRTSWSRGSATEGRAARAVCSTR